MRFSIITAFAAASTTCSYDSATQQYNCAGQYANDYAINLEAHKKPSEKDKGEVPKGPIESKHKNDTSAGGDPTVHTRNKTDPLHAAGDKIAAKSGSAQSEWFSWDDLEEGDRGTPFDVPPRYKDGVLDHEYRLDKVHFTFSKYKKLQSMEVFDSHKDGDKSRDGQNIMKRRGGKIKDQPDLYINKDDCISAVKVTVADYVDGITFIYQNGTDLQVGQSGGRQGDVQEFNFEGGCLSGFHGHRGKRYFTELGFYYTKPAGIPGPHIWPIPKETTTGWWANQWQMPSLRTILTDLKPGNKSQLDGFQESFVGSGEIPSTKVGIMHVWQMRLEYFPAVTKTNLIYKGKEDFVERNCDTIMKAGGEKPCPEGGCTLWQWVIERKAADPKLGFQSYTDNFACTASETDVPNMAPHKCAGKATCTEK